MFAPASSRTQLWLSDVSDFAREYRGHDTSMQEAVIAFSRFPIFV
jgi:hypothetical protein